MLEVEKVELASFVRKLVSDSQLRELFSTDPARAVEASGVSLSSATVQAIVAQSPTIMSATADVDKAMTATFFLIIIVKK
ncbi:MAG: hypothetical protein ACR2KJ_04360 [Jatrophihabitans sp.]